jgi:hypothetical protein
LDFIKLYKCQYSNVALTQLPQGNVDCIFYFFENWKALNNRNRETNYATLMKSSPNMVGTIIVQQTFSLDFLNLSTNASVIIFLQPCLAHFLVDCAQPCIEPQSCIGLSLFLG